MGMPHGMFGHYLKAELNERKIADVNKIASLTPASEVSVPSQGTLVVIIGLQKFPAFNGLKGTVQSFDQESQRYNILLAVPASGHQWAKVKLENIEVLPLALTAPIASSLVPLDDHIIGRHGAADWQGFPSTPRWDDYCQQGHHLLRVNA